MATVKLIIQFIIALPSIFEAIKKLLDWKKSEDARREEEAAKKENAEAAKEMQNAIDAGDIEAQKEALRRLAGRRD
jgi:large-conductance mechanosensitive channel